MVRTEVEQSPSGELSAEKIREQLELLVQDHVFRSSKRSIEFLRYVVEQTLKGCADQIKERTIGVEVFGRAPSYDTNMDHVGRTAAIELRKRLAIYYGEEKHRSELRMSLVPGSYIPRFTLPSAVVPDHNIGTDTAKFSFRISHPADGRQTAADHPAEVAAPIARGRTRVYAVAAVAAIILVAS